MRNITEIEAMSAKDAQDLTTRLGIQLCGTDRFKTDLAERLGFTRPAVTNWFSVGGRPPALVIMYLEAELARQRADEVVRGFNAAIRAAQQY